MSFKLVLTMANAIIGVSILAMPFCYKQCGILLATLMLILSSILAKMCCHLLLKAAILSRSRTYEFLAFHTFGSPGKLAVEVSMIGFMMGTCTAFFVVVGDLAPPIVANIAGLTEDDNLRLCILIGMAIFVVTPLCLLKNLDSLTAICALSLIFYGGVTLYIILTAKETIWTGEWINSVNWWRPAGVFQCLPIFTMALSGQAQVFEIYEALSDPSISKMNQVVSGAVNLCAGGYMSVGFFGYIAHNLNPEFAGNILTAYDPSVMIEIIKIGFSISVALSFPLVVFPCRTAIHSLVFRKTGYSDMIGTNYIPPNRFTGITIFVVAVTLILGIMIPDIEFVLGLVGATIGNVICIILPAVIFVKLTSRNTTERLAAQAIFVIGIVVMVLGTFVNLHMADTSTSPKVFVTPKPAEQAIDHLPVVDNLGPVLARIEEKPRNIVNEVEETNEKARIEPVVPNAPDDDDIKINNKEPKGLVENEGIAKKKLEDEEINRIKEAEAKRKKEKEAIKENELKEKEEKAEKLLKELEKQKEEHKHILEEQKEVLDKMKQHLEADEHQLEKKGLSEQVKSYDMNDNAKILHQEKRPRQNDDSKIDLRSGQNLILPNGDQNQAYLNIDKEPPKREVDKNPAFSNENLGFDQANKNSGFGLATQIQGVNQMSQNRGYDQVNQNQVNNQPNQNQVYNQANQIQEFNQANHNQGFSQPMQNQGNNNALQNQGYNQIQGSFQANAYQGYNQERQNLGYNLGNQNLGLNSNQIINANQDQQNPFNQQPPNQGQMNVNLQLNQGNQGHQNMNDHLNPNLGYLQQQPQITNSPVFLANIPYAANQQQGQVNPNTQFRGPGFASNGPIIPIQNHQQKTNDDPKDNIKKDFKRDVHDNLVIGRDLKFFHF